MMQDPYAALKLENQVCFPLYAASREIVKKYTPILNELDLTYTQYITMMVLWEQRTIAARDLGNKLYLDSGTLTPLLKAMEKKGLLCRCRSTEDERVLMVSVTEKGMALREQALSVPEKIGSCISLEPQEAMELYRILYKILG